jgi:methionyl-tRNA formyltransferase
MKIVFAGTPDFAVPSLKTLLKHHRILAVVTQPDRSRGRGRKIKPSPVKDAVLKYKIPILTKPINQLASQLKKLAPDLIVVVAYGQILSSKILDIPRFGAINLHASLLPKYRGASPIQAAILNGDRETGVSLIKMTPKLDAGPIIAQRKIKITARETAGSLHDKLANLGAGLLEDNRIFTFAQPSLRASKASPGGAERRSLRQAKANILLSATKQNESHATYTKKITTADARLDLSKPAKTLERQIRAYNPWPGAWLKFSIFNFQFSNFKRLKIFKAEIKKESKHPLALQCGDKKLLIPLEVQPEGRKKMSGEEFVRGYLKNLKTQMSNLKTTTN